MIYPAIVSRTLIDKGWSGDKKYCVTTAGGEKYLLRISSMERKERREREFARMQQVSALDIPMCLPVEFGVCDEGVYAIQSWVDGADAEEVIPAMPGDQQYAYGLGAGETLAKIHSIPAPANAPDWETRFNAKIDRKIAMYENCPLKYAGGEAMLQYLASNRHLLAGRPQSYQHGDYHIGNMMIDRDGNLVIIDFDKDDYGDPWEEFNRIVWCAQVAPAFASGMVDGYFGGKVSEEFWRLLALYICSNTLGSLPWAISFGEGEVAVMRKQAAQVLEWYDNMKNTVPTWYREGSVERWDLYNENRELTGKEHIRGKTIPVGSYHLVVHVWIRNSKGEYLISQRSADRPTYPLMWECVGGSVLKGEDSLAGALRETMEEVGVELKPENGRIVFSKVRGMVNGRYFGDIMDVWLFDYDGSVDLARATTKEVAQVKWMSAKQVRQVYESGELVDTLEYFFEKVDGQQR